MKPGNKISAQYYDGRQFVGVITLIENQSGSDNAIWSDGYSGGDRIMVRIRNEKGNIQSFWIDKCLSVDIL